MNYLILGSNGQIGKHLTNYLESRGHVVKTLDISNGKQEDVSDYSIFNEKTIKGIDFVYFLAFDVGGARYLNTYQDTFNFIHNNISILKNVFKVLSETKTPFIFTSTQMSSLSYSPYGVAKRVGEIYTKVLNGLCVRLWNVYGEERDLTKSHVITDFILKARDNMLIDSLTSGEEYRQFLHVEDCCNALYLLSQNYNEIDRDKNLHISSFVWTSVADIAKLVSKYIPSKITFARDVDTVQFNSKIEPDPYILTMWQPTINIDDGIKQMVDYYIGLQAGE
jgi:nucleoside-diphosphate-sugar epimerase